jgi:hypothetical protein
MSRALLHRSWLSAPVGEILFECPRIVGVDEPGVEGHCFRWNHVSSTQFHRADVELYRCYIDDPLERAGANPWRPAPATVVALLRAPSLA